MNFLKLYERLRKVVLERVRSGKTSVAKLSRQTGLSSAHISNVLRGRKGVSLKTLDKILETTLLQIEDLLPWSTVPRLPHGPALKPESPSVPVVASDVVMLNRQIRPEQVLGRVRWMDGSMTGLRRSCSALRKDWDRFVAVRVSEEQAAPMRQQLVAGATAFIDRHYTSPNSYWPDRPTLYAVQVQARLHFRYVNRSGNFLILSALDPATKPRMLELKATDTAEELIIGRVVNIVIPV